MKIMMLINVAHNRHGRRLRLLVSHAQPLAQLHVEAARQGNARSISIETPAFGAHGHNTQTRTLQLMTLSVLPPDASQQNVEQCLTRRCGSNSTGWNEFRGAYKPCTAAGTMGSYLCNQNSHEGDGWVVCVCVCVWWWWWWCVCVCVCVCVCGGGYSNVTDPP